MSRPSFLSAAWISFWSVAAIHPVLTVAAELAIEPGPVNKVVFSEGGAKLAIYGCSANDAPTVEQLLLTHHRRDVVSRSIQQLHAKTTVVAPEADREWLEKPEEFWNAFTKSRFHDYACFTTKVIPRAVKVDRWVREGDSLQWHGIKFDVFDTPGYTRGAVSYVATVDGKRLAFTGDLIYGDGQLLDLYSFQDAIPEASIRGYHGYASRLSQLVASLRKIADLKPDRIIPSRGPTIENPQAAIDKLIARIGAIYKNYLSTNALHWYFKEDRMRQCGARILGQSANVELMPYSLVEKTPDWVFENATSRLLISDAGSGFLIDCGYQRVIDAVEKLIDSGIVNRIEGIFVTHYHDDHTDMVQAAAEQFKCPVYAMAEYVDILENPSAYHMPAMTAAPIKNVQSLESGHAMKWHEFDLTFQYFPGQTYYHGGVLVRHLQERPIYFVGDSFAPSGLDDYCLQNRNLVHAEGGYKLCFKKLREVREPVWIVNEHIPFVFQFTDAELTNLEKRYEERSQLLKELFPWDSANYGIDEQWAVFYPYGVETKSGQEIELEVRLTNHSPGQRTFKVTPNLDSNMRLIAPPPELSLESNQRGSVKMKIAVGPTKGNQIVTADVRSEGMDFLDWIEALVTVD